jgi:hypothetical protein
MRRDTDPVAGGKRRRTLRPARPGSEIEGGGAGFELADLVDGGGLLDSDSQVADRLRDLAVAELAKDE